VGIATDGCGWLRCVIGSGVENEMSERNRKALLMALEALEAERREYEPGLHKYEVLYGDWEIEEVAADRYAEITEAIERIRKLLDG